jgi:hypothetical protein
MLSESLALSEVEWIEASLTFINDYTFDIKRDSSTPLRSAQNDNNAMIERSSDGNIGDFRKRGLI